MPRYNEIVEDPVLASCHGIEDFDSLAISRDYREVTGNLCARDAFSTQPTALKVVTQLNAVINVESAIAYISPLRVAE